MTLLKAIKIGRTKPGVGSVQAFTVLSTRLPRICTRYSSVAADREPIAPAINMRLEFSTHFLSQNTIEHTHISVTVFCPYPGNEGQDALVKIFKAIEAVQASCMPMRKVTEK